MAHYDLLVYLPVVSLLIWAAAQDLYARRIPNWLTVSLALAGIAWSFAIGHPVTPGEAMLGFAAGFGLTFVLFGLGALGGGDVKLLAALGTWLGPAPVFKVFVMAAVIGMIIVVVQSLMQRRTRTLLRNSAVLAINLVHLNELGAEQVMETGRESRSVDRPLPYAVPVLLATLALLVLA
jgi:prepilin peptidase CpaA